MELLQRNGMFCIITLTQLFSALVQRKKGQAQSSRSEVNPSTVGPRLIVRFRANTMSGVYPGQKNVCEF